MRYQNTWKQNEPEAPDPEGQKNLEDTIQRSLDHGINHIETARGYGSSEYQLGICLKKHNRQDIILQSKVSPKEKVEDFLTDFETSLSLLQTDYLDLFAIHGINNEVALEQTVRPGGCLDAALKLKKEGRIRHLGFSTHGSTELILKVLDHEEFEYINLHWYYILQDNLPCIKKAHSRDMGIFIISPNDKGGKLYDPPKRLSDLTSPFSPMVFNDLFCLSNPYVHTLSLGAAKPSDFDEHLKVLDHLDHCSSQIESISKNLDQLREDHLGKELLNYKRELPQWEKCPQQINLQMILHLWNLAKAFDMIEYGKMRYNLLDAGSHWFPGAKFHPDMKTELQEFLTPYPNGQQVLSAIEEAHELLKGEEVKRLSQS